MEISIQRENTYRQYTHKHNTTNVHTDMDRHAHTQISHSDKAFRLCTQGIKETDNDTHTNICLFVSLIHLNSLIPSCRSPPSDSCHFTLDPNTAHRNLHLSEGNRRVERRDEVQSYPDHPERFDGFPQVLCREGVSGRCYWEVERSEVWVHISVSYKSISRRGRGNECRFGYNDQSWSLNLYSTGSIFWHNNKGTNLPLVVNSRIGVYVDHRAGTLTFYSISDTMTLLHRVQTTFTHTLYPGFRFWSSGSSVKLL